MLKKIFSIIFIAIILLTGNFCYAANYKYNSLDSYYNEKNYGHNSLNSYYNEKNYGYNSLDNYYNDTNVEHQLVIEDDAQLLTDSEEKSLKEIMAKLTEYGNIIFKSINTNNTTADSYAKSYYNGKYGDKSGTLFLIDMDNRKIYIFSNGDNYTKITNSKAETITDNVYTLATDKKYYECAKQAYEQILIVLEGGKIAEPMKYISNGVLSVMISLFIVFAIYKTCTSNKKASGREQIKECERFLEHTTPVIKKVGTHSVYCPPSRSSGGGSSHGGGGGRRRWRRP